MARQYSDVERANLRWFQSDFSVATLRKIVVRKGEVRGLKKAGIDFEYPITAIAGKNGCGKSTFIALAACAFHNSRTGWRLPDRSDPYYTFSDFFVQAGGEKPLDGVEIWYAIQHDGWQRSSRLPEGKGLAWQVSKKRKGGRWTDYDERVDRPVAFLGVERVVPSVEKSVFRSYRRRFSAGERTGFEEAVCTAVSKVLSVPYDSFEFREHGKYRLPWVQKRRGAGYSGFNMGAGEKALFEFFATVLSAPKGALFLIDEIELGLHEQAQSKLISVLNDISRDRHIQIICTTHSPTILEKLPPEGRVYVSASLGGVSVLPGVSAEYATGRMSGRNSREMTIYVEDQVASDLVDATLLGDLRSRIEVCPIGSHTAVMNAMVTQLKNPNLGSAVAFLDGDQYAVKNAHLKKFVGLAEAHDGAKEWIDERLFFLPGGVTPEVFVLGKLRDFDSDILSEAFQFSGDEIIEAIDSALLAGSHGELRSLSQALHREQRQVWRDACRLLVRFSPDSVREMQTSIVGSLASRS